MGTRRRSHAGRAAPSSVPPDAQFLPAALVAGKAATQALGSFAEMLRDAVDFEREDSPSDVKAAEYASGVGLPATITSLLKDFTASFHQLLGSHNLGTGGVRVWSCQHCYCSSVGGDFFLMWRLKFEKYFGFFYQDLRTKGFSFL